MRNKAYNPFFLAYFGFLSIEAKIMRQEREREK